MTKNEGERIWMQQIQDDECRRYWTNAKKDWMKKWFSLGAELEVMYAGASKEAEQTGGVGHYDAAATANTLKAVLWRMTEMCQEEDEDER